MKKVIGITGSIGSGKSYAVQKFKEICKAKKRKAIFLDVDTIRRKILEEEKIDKVQLNQKIYNDSKAMENYKKYINPKIKQYLEKEVVKAKDSVLFIEWGLLLEDGFFDIVDSIIMINCQREVQIKRLENGDLGKEAILKRINLQLTNQQKIEKIKQLNKEYYIIDTTNNPLVEAYQDILKKEGVIL